MNELYRREVSESLSSPEQLDAMIRITRPIDWAVLAITLLILAAGTLWAFFGHVPMFVDGAGVLTWDRPGAVVYSAAAGQLVELRVKPHEVVSEGSVVAILQSAATYPEVSRVEVVAPQAGRVGQILVVPGAMVAPGTAILELAPVDARVQVVAYVSVLKGKRIQEDMQVQVSPATIDRQVYGFLPGVVTKVGTYVVTAEQIKQRLGDALGSVIAKDGGAFIDLEIRLHEDASKPSGFRWSSGEGPPFRPGVQTVCNVQLVTHTERPVDLVLPFLQKNLEREP